MSAVALLYCGEALHSASLNNTPALRHLHQWMESLVPGATVIEVTTARDTDDDSRIGTLVSQGREWVAYSEAEGGFWEDYTIIRTFDGREVRWVNCHWVRIPTTRDEWRDARRVPAHIDGSGVSS